MYRIIQTRNYWYGFSGILTLASIILLFIWGMNFGIDFTGGTLLHAKFTDPRPSSESVSSTLGSLNIGSIELQPSGQTDFIIRMAPLTEEQHQQVLTKLKELNGTQESYELIGPTVGKELKTKSLWALILASLAIVAYVAYAFRKVSSGPVPSWFYGVAAIIALLHDLIVMLGTFVLLGHFMHVEINTMFVTAMLTVLGYSVNDTIVVFDRVRENLKTSHADTFEEVINESINQTMARSLNTSLTTIFTLLALLFFGGETIRYFVLALIVGITTGTYSSIFIASPVLLIGQKIFKR